MQNEQRNIVKTITQILWGMRGGLSREEAWNLSPSEIKEIAKLMEERKKLTEDTGLPLL